MTTGYNVADAYEMQLGSMNNQIIIFKNNITAMTSILFESYKNTLIPFMLGMNKLGEGFKDLNQTSPMLGSVLKHLSGSLFVAATSFGILITATKALNVAYAFTAGILEKNPWIFVATSIITAVGAVVSLSKVIRSLELEKVQATADTLKRIGTNKSDIEGLNIQLESLQRELSDIIKGSTTSDIEKQQEAWERYSKAVGTSNDSLDDILKNIKEISNTDPLKSIKQSDVIKARIDSNKRGLARTEEDLGNFGEAGNLGEATLGRGYKNITFSEMALLQQLKKESVEFGQSFEKRVMNFPKIYEKLLPNKYMDFVEETTKLFSYLPKDEGYTEYLRLSEIKSKYEKNILAREIEYTQALIKEKGAQVDAITESSNKAKDIVMGYGVQDLIKTTKFGDFNSQLQALTGKNMKDYITPKKYSQYSQEGFNIDFLKSEETNKAIYNIEQGKAQISELKNQY